MTRTEIMTRAWAICNGNRTENRFSECLRQAWDEVKNPEIKRYTFCLTAARADIARYIGGLYGCEKDVHDVHKVQILLNVLRRPVDENGIATMTGKEVGLCKYALRNA